MRSFFKGSVTCALGCVSQFIELTLSLLDSAGADGDEDRPAKKKVVYGKKKGPKKGTQPTPAEEIPAVEPLESILKVPLSLYFEFVNSGHLFWVPTFQFYLVLVGFILSLLKCAVI